MQETNTIRFFRELASRMYKENDLSDIVYALCESNCQFKQFFLNFFFHDFQLSATEARIQREVQYDDGSRPDFVIRCPNRTFFVESKIWDRSHHFSQYAKTLSSQEDADESNLAYITNYTIIPESLSKADRVIYEKVKTRVHTWKSFRKELERIGDDPVERSWATGEDIQGFVEYCRRVCPSIEVETVDSFIFRSSDFRFVREFYTSLKTALEAPLSLTGQTVQLAKYSRGKFNNPGDWFGVYFSVADLLNENEMIWGWMGCYLEKHAPAGLCIEFLNKNGWGAPVFRKLGLREYQIDYCYELKYSESEVIRANLKEALQSVVDGNPPIDRHNSLNTPEQLKNMRRFALFLEQNVLNGLFEEDGDIRLEVVHLSDSQDPSGWCGVYFVVVTEDQEHDSREISRNQGWLGVYFDNKVRVEGHPYEDGSRIVLEWKGTTSLVDAPSDGSALDSEQIKQRVKELLTMQD